jgi:cell division protein FtsI (penicillin-binding protein 3)
MTEEELQTGRPAVEGGTRPAGDADAANGADGAASFCGGSRTPEGPGHGSASGPGASRQLKTRATVALGIVLASLVALTGRLGRLQIVEGPAYRRLADRQQILSRELAAQRGNIYDRNGRLLASTIRRWSIYADPKGVKQPDLTAATLSPILGISRGLLTARFGRDSCFAWLGRQVSDALAEKVRNLGLPGIYMRRECKRLYPQGALAAQVVGFTDVDGRGLAGIESRLDPLLRGRPGMESVLCDGGRHPIFSPQARLERAPFNGYDVVLTLDAYIQNIAEQELAEAVERHEPEAATAIVMDVRDGSILAMASWPAFNPQAPARTSPRALRDMAINDAYEYGSAFKPIPVSLALERGVTTPDSRFDCHNGSWLIGKRMLHDVHPYGILTVSDIITESSNIGAAQVSMLLGAQALYAGVCSFGLGAPTGIALPGEVGGIMRPGKLWNQYSVVSVAFGQEMAVTPIAMVRAFAAFANGGKLLQPRIVKTIRHAGTGEVIYTAGDPVVTGRPISADTAQKVLEMMRRVVDEGTGRSARNDEYPLAGKTGTAQLLRPDRRGYGDRHLSTFIGLGPLPECRIAILVTLKAPTKGGYYGGTVAAPAVKNIAIRTLRYMEVPPAPPVEVAMENRPEEKHDASSPKLAASQAD